MLWQPQSWDWQTKAGCPAKQAGGVLAAEYSNGWTPTCCHGRGSPYSTQGTLWRWLGTPFLGRIHGPFTCLAQAASSSLAVTPKDWAGIETWSVKPSLRRIDQNSRFIWTGIVCLGHFYIPETWTNAWGWIHICGIILTAFSGLGRDRHPWTERFPKVVLWGLSRGSEGWGVGSPWTK